MVRARTRAGESVRRGAITKTGNAHLRRIVVEAAWAYQHRPAVGRELQKRQGGLSEEVKEIAWKAQHRLRTMNRGLPFAARFAKTATRGCYMAGRAVGVIGMLTLAVPLPVSPASADPIRITGGSMIAEVRQGDEVGRVDIQGTQGFELRLGLDLRIDDRAVAVLALRPPRNLKRSDRLFYVGGWWWHCAARRCFLSR